jgi:hypothetical protein
VVATGSNLSYQWLKDDASVSGATSSTYTIGSAALADAGSYRVVVTNTVDGATYTATSDTATLTVSNTGSGAVTIN